MSKEKKLAELDKKVESKDIPETFDIDYRRKKYLKHAIVNALRGLKHAKKD